MSDDTTTRILSALDRLEAGQTQQGRTLESLKDGQERLRVDVMSRIDRLQDRIKSLIEQVDVSFGAASQAQLIAKNLRNDLQSALASVDGVRGETEELRALVDRIERQIRNLSSEVDTLRDSYKP